MKKISIVVILMLLSFSIFAQVESSRTYNNPILPGFYPDPSICRVNDDYYLVNSSFEWFPGIPIHHSKDLVNWEQIGYVLDHPSQLNMKPGMKASAGVWAPTIRFINNRYYVIVTAKQCGNTFYVSSDKPQGPWSEPVYLKDAPGIDPSLFCDDDGTVWLCANDRYKSEEMQKGQTSNEFIWLQKIDLTKGKLYGERYRLTHGLTLKSLATEGPHIYKINGKYYLLTAEGMTWNNHAVAMFKSDKIIGPYKACNSGKPVMTHRDLNQNGLQITTTGHADLIQTQNNEWWAVMLAVRPVNGNNLLGRESFLCPVKWNGDEPVFAPDDNERLSMKGKAPNLPSFTCNKTPILDEFDKKELGMQWNFLRTPHSKYYTINNGELSLSLRPERVEDLVSPSLIARRVQHHKFSCETEINFTPENENEEGGIIIMQNSTNFYKLTITSQNRKRVLRLVKSNMRKAEVYETIYCKQIPDGKIILGIEGDGLKYNFFYRHNTSSSNVTVSQSQDAAICSSNVAGGFTGSYVGMYASSNNQPTKNAAIFKWFKYSSNKI